MQNSLVVAFHRDASPTADKDALEKIIFNLYPQSVTISTQQDLTARIRLNLTRSFRHSIHGDNASEAVSNFKEQMSRHPIVIVTDRDDMKLAATEANIPVIDAGNNFHSISDALRDLSLQHG